MNAFLLGAWQTMGAACRRLDCPGLLYCYHDERGLIFYIFNLPNGCYFRAVKEAG